MRDVHKRTRAVFAFAALLLLLVVKPPALAQDGYPRAELFGGFSYLKAGLDDFPRKGSYGFQTSLCGNLNRWFGVVADFGGQYGKTGDLGATSPPWRGVSAETSVYQYLAGPRFAWRGQKYTFFAHALAGGAQGRTNIQPFADGGMALGGGAGLDINVGDRLAIRVLQFDYLASFVDMMEGDPRFGFGIVIKLGR